MNFARQNNGLIATITLIMAVTFIGTFSGPWAQQHVASGLEGIGWFVTPLARAISKTDFLTALFIIWSALTVSTYFTVWTIRDLRSTLTPVKN